VGEQRVGPIRRGAYEVTLHYARGYERHECVGVDVRSVERTAPTNHLRPIAASALRALRIGELIDDHRPIEFVVVEAAGEPPVGLVVEERGRGGRPPLYTAQHWDEVAETYRKAFAEGRLTPTRAVARRFNVPPSTAAKWVSRCRNFGLLPPTTRGRPRGAAPSGKPRRKG
jgi:hypothetical protein